jgi:hypothetical protein
MGIIGIFGIIMLTASITSIVIKERSKNGTSNRM